MNEQDKQCIGRIRNRYGSLIKDAAQKHNHRPAVIAGILMRETRGGESNALRDADGIQDDNPADDTGDAGHGHGLMQIDDRSYPAYCASDEWKDPANNITFGSKVLEDKRRFLSQSGLPDSILEHASISAYNCGEGNVLKSFRAGEDLDLRTTGRDYGKAVLEYAAAYEMIVALETPPEE